MKNVKFYAAKILKMARNYIVITQWQYAASWVGALAIARKLGLTVVREDAATVTVYQGY